MTEPALDYEKLADLIASKMRMLPPDIWDTQACADFFGCSRVHFTDRVSKRHSFPKPVKGFKTKWFATEVIDWSQKRQSSFARSAADLLQ